MIRWFICGNKATDMKENAQIEILRKYSQDVKGDSQIALSLSFSIYLK
jgi:hypothetical protein